MEELAWSVRPFDAAPRRGALALGLAAVATLLAAHWGGTALGILGGIVTFGAIGPYFVKTRYRLGPDAVSVASPFHRVTRPWTAFRRVEIGRGSVRLSPYARRHPMDPYRSVLLHYGEHQEEILERVRTWGTHLEGGSGVRG